MAPSDVIFELFRISTAGLPGAGARQFEGGPEAVRVPEIINLRPNKFNLDLTKRLDHMRCGTSDGDLGADELDLDEAFANWESPAGSAKVIGETQKRDQQLVDVSVGKELSSLLPVLACEDVVSLELSVIECLASMGLSQSRIEIFSRESGER